MSANWDDPELILEFIEEATERLDAADASLLQLEKRPQDGNASSGAMGALHSLKGAAGFVGLTHLQEVVHATETLLSGVRDQQTAEQAVDLAFEAITAMRDHLEELGRCCREDSALDRSTILQDYQDRLARAGVAS